MAIIYINKSRYDINTSKNLLQTCLSLNIDIPYFCWHPDLGSVGVCRLCAVKQFNNINDVSGKMIMSCMTPVVDSMIIHTHDKEIIKFRKGLIELLMLNHPHDCPVCEEGGHCHLQDMTVLTGHNMRRYIFPKRIHRNQYLGDFISHQMNRCIGCYRCVRYYQDYAGGTDFGVYGISNSIYFGRFKDGNLKNEFSGNLIEICPTGVFTDKVSSKWYNRKWDLQYAPSVCPHCNIGCNIIGGEKYGILSKIENRYHRHINRYFLCDLGRFGHGYTNMNNRLKNPVKYFNGKYIILNTKKSITLTAKILNNACGMIGIGSIRSSLESNFALRKLVGKNNFSSGMNETDHKCVKLIIDILNNSGLYTPTLLEVEDYDVVLILGEDITQTSPRLSLALRQLSKKKQRDVYQKNIPEWHSVAVSNSSNKKKFIYILHTHETNLDDISKFNYYASIKDQEIFASILESKIKNSTDNFKNISFDAMQYVIQIYKVLLACKKPLIISGMHSGSINLIKLATNIAKRLQILKKEVGLILLTQSSNSIGVGIMSNMSVTHALKKIVDNKIDTLVILENDLYRHNLHFYTDNVIKKLKNIIVFDYLKTKTTQKSTVLFPTTNFIESSGTIINYESRAQRFFSVFDPKIYDNKTCVAEAWKWIYKIYYKMNNLKNSSITLDDVINNYIHEIPIFQNIKYVAPNEKYRILGQKIARSPHRLSSRTAIFSELSVHEPQQKYDKNTMFTFSMEGIQQPSKDIEYIPFVWSPGWNSNQSWNKYIFNNDHYNSGIRIFKSSKTVNEYIFNDISMRNLDDNLWYIVPNYFIFGTEELSQNSDIIRKKYSIVYAVLNKYYKKKFELTSNSMIQFECLGQIFKLLVKFSETLPLKQLALPIGYPNIPRILLGCTVKNIRGIT